MTDARQNNGAIMARYKERKKKIFQQRKEKSIETQRAKEEAGRKMRERRINLVSGVAELGGPWKSAKGVKEGLRKIATDKKKQKALVMQLQFQKIL